MKINEIIVEALNQSTGTPNGSTNPGYQNDEVHVDPRTGEADFSGLKQAWQGAKMLGRGVANLPNRIKGAVAGVQASQAQRAATVAGGQNLQLEFNAWKQFATQRAPVVNMKDPATLQTQLQDWADTRYPSSKGQIDVSKVRAGNQTDIQNYITNRYNTALANRTSSAGAKTQNTPNVANEILNKLVGRAEQAGDRIGADDVTKELSAFQLSPIDRREMTKQILEKLKGFGIEISAGPNGANPGQAPTLSPGVRVISSDPVVLGYDKRKYALNRQNQWVNFGSSRPTSPEMAKFLNKQAQAL